MQAKKTPDSSNNSNNNCTTHNKFRFPPIPKDLEYLLEPGVHYGRRYQLDNEIQDFLENGKESEFEALDNLAKRAQLSGDYVRINLWMDEVDNVIEDMIDEAYPYNITISKKRRKFYLSLINESNVSPEIAERQRERKVRLSAEMEDLSEIAERRREMRGELTKQANDSVHYMDVYFLFGLMFACNIDFE